MRPLVVVDGAGGFLGGHVVRALLEAGYPVRAVDLPGVSLDHLKTAGAQVEAFDLNRPDSLAAPLAGAGIIVHLAALFDLTATREQLFRTNVTGTENLLNAAVQLGITRFIHISSGDNYGPLQFVPATEDHPLNPLNPYAASKVRAEEVVVREAHQHGLKTTILRPSMMYGPNSRYIACMLFAVPAILVGHGVKKIPFFRGGIQFTPVHVEDVARAVVFAADHDETAGQVYNVAQPQITTIGDLFQEIYRAIGLKIGMTIPLPKILISMIGRLGLALPDRMFAGIVNHYVARKWAEIQQEYGLDKSFILKFNKDIFSYFIGERAFSTERLIKAGFDYKYPTEALGIPPTIRWYVDHKWLPHVL